MLKSEIIFVRKYIEKNFFRLQFAIFLNLIDCIDSSLYIQLTPT